MIGNCCTRARGSEGLFVDSSESLWWPGGVLAWGAGYTSTSIEQF